jgi:hypothetical protein
VHATVQRRGQHANIPTQQPNPATHTTIRSAAARRAAATKTGLGTQAARSNGQPSARRPATYQAHLQPIVLRTGVMHTRRPNLPPTFCHLMSIANSHRRFSIFSSFLPIWRCQGKDYDGLLAGLLRHHLIVETLGLRMRDVSLQALLPMLVLLGHPETARRLAAMRREARTRVLERPDAAAPQAAVLDRDHVDGDHTRRQSFGLHLRGGDDGGPAAVTPDASMSATAARLRDRV